MYFIFPISISHNSERVDVLQKKKKNSQTILVEFPGSFSFFSFLSTHRHSVTHTYTCASQLTHAHLSTEFFTLPTYPPLVPMGHYQSVLTHPHLMNIVWADFGPQTHLVCMSSLSSLTILNHHLKLNLPTGLQPLYHKHPIPISILGSVYPYLIRIF